jgi:uncharacterized radical SAM protein YgiQ
MTPAEMKRLGWDVLDVLIVTGDAYVDHPAFGAALVGRWLVARGFRVGIVAQPRWQGTQDVVKLGRPRLFVGISAGAMDSMLAHYTAFRKKRHEDAYTPGGRAGARPNRASIVYTSLVRHAFPGVPVVLGGIEASMRRATHYDFWSDSLRPSILLDSKADLLVYGMAERAVIEVADRLKRHPEAAGARDTAEARRLLRGIPGTGWIEDREADLPSDKAVWRLPSHEDICADRSRLMEATLTLERHVHRGGAWVVQAAGPRLTVLAAPAPPLMTAEMDALYSLPFARRAHPSYAEPIPALEMAQFSVTTHRGCAGGCSFCSLALHQGRRIRSRSRSSILGEAQALTRHPDWKGSISDVGGPTANMWGAACAGDPAGCNRVSCLWPGICAHFRSRQADLADLLRAVQAAPGVRRVRTASGVRHDLALTDAAYVRALVTEFVGGQLKLAPEHRCDRVLALMRKPPFEAFERFRGMFEALSREAGKEQYIVPYLISAFPGCTESDMRELAEWLRVRRWSPRQVQCFVPTPGTVATAMYCAGTDPLGCPIPVARTDAERLWQHRILLQAAGGGPPLARGGAKRSAVRGGCRPPRSAPRGDSARTPASHRAAGR